MLVDQLLHCADSKAAVDRPAEALWDSVWTNLSPTGVLFLTPHQVRYRPA